MLHLISSLTFCCILAHHISFGNRTENNPESLTSPEEDLEESACLVNVHSTAAFKPANCIELKQQGYTKSGLYTIYPRSWYNVLPFDVYCDMHTDGGGWTVIQRRDDYGDPSDSFYRPWNDYKEGFGKLTEEFWLGNDRISVLTKQDQVALRIELEDFQGEKRYATYQVFKVASAAQDYKLTANSYSGDAGDSVSYHDGAPFVTFDKNDAHHCSTSYKGGWWYKTCHYSNLNGLYLKGKHESYANGLNWFAWHGYHYSLKRTELKIRPVTNGHQ